MEIHELVIEIKRLERRMTLYEEKYGILSKDFYEALMSGELERFDEFDETRANFSQWKGIYESWARRKQVYDEQLTQRRAAATLRLQSRLLRMPGSPLLGVGKSRQASTALTQVSTR